MGLGVKDSCYLLVGWMGTCEPFVLFQHQLIKDFSSSNMGPTVNHATVYRAPSCQHCTGHRNKASVLSAFRLHTPHLTICWAGGRPGSGDVATFPKAMWLVSAEVFHLGFSCCWHGKKLFSCFLRLPQLCWLNSSQATQHCDFYWDLCFYTIHRPQVPPWWDQKNF